MNAPIVVILAAGQGTRMRSAHAEGPARPLRAADDRVAGRRRARGRRRRGSSSSTRPQRPLDGQLPDGRRARRPARAERDRRRRRGRRRRCSTRDGRSSSSTATSRSSPPRRSASSSSAHAASGAAATMATTELDDPTGYGRVVRGDDGVASSASSRRRPAATRRAEELAIREVNTGIYAFDGGALLERARRGSTPDNAQGELYLPDVLPLLRDAGRDASPRTSFDDPAIVARRQRPRRPRRACARSPSARIHRGATCARA